MEIFWNKNLSEFLSWKITDKGLNGWKIKIYKTYPRNHIISNQKISKKYLPKLLFINFISNLSILYLISGNPQICQWVPSVQLVQDIRVLKEDFQLPVKLQQKQNYHTSWSNLVDTKSKVQSSKLDAISSRCDELRIQNIFCNTNNRVFWKFKSIKNLFKTVHYLHTESRSYSVSLLSSYVLQIYTSIKYSSNKNYSFLENSYLLL